jgi:hypothetical protein
MDNSGGDGETWTVPGKRERRCGKETAATRPEHARLPLDRYFGELRFTDRANIWYKIRQKFRYAFVDKHTIFNTEMNIRIKSICIHIGILFLILICVSSAGCIKQVQGHLGQSGNPTESDNELVPATVQVLESDKPAGPVKEVDTQVTTTTQLPSSASTIDPIYPAEHFRTIRNLTEKNGENVTLPTQNAWSSRTPLYTLHYSPRYDASAILVNVTHGPLVIIFKATPKINDPRVSFADVTVRELPGKGIVAEERIDHYPSSTSSGDESDSDGGTVSSSGPRDFGESNQKQIVIYKESSYHINVYGNQVDVDMAVYTGDSPVLSKASSASAGNTEIPEEEFW